MTDSQQHIEALRLQLSALHTEAAALKAQLSHSVLIEFFDQSVGFPLSDVSTFLVEASHTSSPKWTAVWLAKAADSLDEARTMMAQMEGTGVRSRPEYNECPPHAYRDQSR